MGRIPICILAGTSGSGKTTLMEKIVADLSSRGLKIATVKHTPKKLTVDKPGKDSHRHRQAGAAATFLVTDGEIVGFIEKEREVSPDDLLGYCPPGTDILLVEGFKHLRGYPKVAMIAGTDDVDPDPDIICGASETPGLHCAPYPVFHRDDSVSISGLIAENLLGK